ncbi:MAG: hypothetical protein ACFE9I_00660 [Candidatus Hermodarchaeota archaeon]
MKRYITIIISLFTILVVFFAPFGIMIDLGPGPNSIVSMIWEVPLRPAWYSIRFFSAFLYYFEYIFFRLIFVVYVILLMIGKFNKKRFILIGLISELIPLVMAIVSTFILNEHGDNLHPIIYPIPFLMIFDLIIVYLTSRLGLIKVNNEIYKNKNLKENMESGSM